MRELSQAVADELKRASPLNPYGELMFRVSWSADVQQWVSGWWNDYDSTTGAFIRRVFEARKGPRYQFAPRWIIEQWQPPEFFGTREMWESATEEWSATHGFMPELGPYPSRGDYLIIWKCEDIDKSFMEITPTLVRYTIDLALRPKPTDAELIAHAAARRAQDQQELTKALDDLIGDPFPFLGRTNNLTPRPLISKIRDQKKRGKDV